MRVHRAFPLFFAFVLPAGILAQVQDPSTQMGSALYATFQNGDVDQVNLDNGNLFLNIPLVSFPQRGSKLKMNFIVRFNRPQWNVGIVEDAYDEYGEGDVIGQWWLNEPSVATSNGVDVVRDQFLSNRKTDVTFVCYEDGCGNDNQPPASAQPVSSINTVGLWQVRTPDGGMHSYAMTAEGNGSAYVQSTTPDGSRITPLGQAGDPYDLKFLDGTGVLYTPVTGAPTNDSYVAGYNVSDPDGNHISLGANGWTDSIGRLIPGSPGPPLPPVSSQIGPFAGGEDDLVAGVETGDYSKCNGATSYARVWNIPSVNGTTQQYVFCYEDFYYQSAFNVNSIGTYYPPGTLNYTEGNGTTRILYEIVLPDNTNYQFSYDSYVDLTQITFPTGGSISYTWGSAPINASLTNPVQRVVTSRTVMPGGTSPTGQWKYQWLIAEGAYLSDTIVTDPNGNDTQHSPQNSPTPFRDVYYSGRSPNNPIGTGPAGTVLKTVVNDRPGLASPFYTSIYEENDLGPVTNAITSYPDGHSTQVINTYYPAQSIVNVDWRSWSDGAFDQSIDSGYQTYDCPCINYELADTTSAYAYGANAPGALINTTTTNYEWQTNGAYLTANLLSLPSSIVTTDGQSNRIAGTNYAYDESPSPSGARGHTTTVSKWLNINNSSTSNKTTFSSYGMPTDTYDANYVASASTGNHVHTTYDSNGMYPVSVSQSTTTNGIAHVDYYSYDFNTGLISSHTDQNGSSATDAAHTTSFSYADPLARLTKVIFPPVAAGTPEVDFTYNLSTNTVTKSERQGGGVTLYSSVQYDGFLKAIRTVDTAGATVDTAYNTIGKAASKTNPYIGTSAGSTTFLYDALGRLVKQTDQDGSAQWFCFDGQSDPIAAQPNCHTNYSSTIGEWVDSTDEDGRLTQHVEDSRGNVAEVSEFPGGPSGSRLETDYLYYPSGNLQTINQLGLSSETPRQRNFTYDSLSRLITTSNPETGTICYGTLTGSVCQEAYDPNGNLLTKTDQNGTTLNYHYDALGRLDHEWTNSTPTNITSINDQYSYDNTASGANGVGRVYSEWNSDSQRSYSYDALGEVLNTAGTVLHGSSSDSSSVVTAYDLAGHPTQITYPDGKIIKGLYDSTGRLSSVQDVTNGPSGPTYYQTNNYWPAGIVHTSTLGNGVTMDAEINTRLQVTELFANSPVLSAIPGVNGNLYDKTIGYTNPSSPGCPQHSSTANNGNIYWIADMVDPSRTQGFDYDCLNRLVTAGRSDGAYNHAYVIDSFGNMLKTDYINGNSTSLSIDPSTNRLFQNGTTNATSDFQYDGAGELVQDPFVRYAYTAKGMIAQLSAGSSATYSYFPSGVRSAKNTASTTWIDYVYSPGGSPLAEHSSDGSWTDYIYAGGTRVAVLSGTNSPLYFLDDHLGTLAMELNLDGSVHWQGDFTPYGQDIIGGGTNNALGYHDDGATSHYKFTGKERDAESGFDYFGARYYGSTTGRFMSPDWSVKVAPVPYAKLDDPQTLNLYAYVGNNPLARIDADGHMGNPFSNYMQRPRTQPGGYDALVSESVSDWQEQLNFDLVAAQSGQSSPPPPAASSPAQQQSAQSQAAQVPGAVKAAIMNSVNASSAPSGADTTGGFHEESGVAGTNAAGGLVISPDKPGGYSNPDTSNHVSTTHTPVDQDQRNSISTFSVFWHVHPSGTTATHGWVQPPSAQDQSVVVPGPINIVVGAGNRTVYFYNGSSVQSMSLKNFMKP